MINLVSCCFLDEKLYFTEQFSLLTYSVSALLFCCKLDNFSNIKFKCIPRAVSKGWICHGCNDHDPGYFCKEQTEKRTKTTSQLLKSYMCIPRYYRHRTKQERNSTRQPWITPKANTGCQILGNRSLKNQLFQ